MLNVRTNSVTRTIDTQPPSATLSTNASQSTNLSTIPFLVEFDEHVNGFTINDITITGTATATASNLTQNGNNFTFDVDVTSDGDLTVQILAK